MSLLSGLLLLFLVISEEVGLSKLLFSLGLLGRLLSLLLLLSSEEVLVGLLLFFVILVFLLFALVEPEVEVHSLYLELVDLVDESGVLGCELDLLSGDLLERDLEVLGLSG